MRGMDVDCSSQPLLLLLQNGCWEQSRMMAKEKIRESCSIFLWKLITRRKALVSQGELGKLDSMQVIIYPTVASGTEAYQSLSPSTLPIMHGNMKRLHDSIATPNHGLKPFGHGDAALDSGHAAAPERGSVSSSRSTSRTPTRKSCEFCRTRRKKCDGNGVSRCRWGRCRRVVL